MKRRLETGERWAGIEATYDDRAKTVTLFGWYDTYAGIAPETFTLAHFLTALGVTLDDCRKALEDEHGI